MNKTHKVQVWTDVDAIFDWLDEGGRQHLANKLNKHGYINPKLFNSTTPQEKIDELVDENGLEWCMIALSRNA